MHKVYSKSNMNAYTKTWHLTILKFPIENLVLFNELSIYYNYRKLHGEYIQAMNIESYRFDSERFKKEADRLSYGLKLSV